MNLARPHVTRQSEAWKGPTYTGIETEIDLRQNARELWQHGVYN